MDYPNNLLDILASIEAADKAISQVGASADPRWVRTVYGIITELAFKGEGFTTDQIWNALDRCKVVSPHEPRALGFVMRQACSDGLIKPTGEYRPSLRPQCHRNPKRVWTKA